MFEKKNKNGKRGMHNYLEKLRDDGHFFKKEMAMKKRSSAKAKQHK
jgi:hypothetical protein